MEKSVFRLPFFIALNLLPTQILSPFMHIALVPILPVVAKRGASGVQFTEEIVQMQALMFGNACINLRLPLFVKRLAHQCLQLGRIRLAQVWGSDSFVIAA